MTHFKARLNPLLKGYTLILLFGIVAAALFELTRGHTSTSQVLFVAFGALLLIGLFSVRGYAVDGTKLLIERPGRHTAIDLRGVLAVSPEPKLVRSSISLWSTRGLFGFIGYGYKKGLGGYHAYVTDPTSAVLLAFRSGRRIVISPESPDAFISAVIQQAGEPAAGLNEVIKSSR